nr:F-box/kelch-repeat protein At3g23880-like [Ipomoea batatas]
MNIDLCFQLGDEHESHTVVPAIIARFLSNALLQYSSESNRNRTVFALRDPTCTSPSKQRLAWISALITFSAGLFRPKRPITADLISISANESHSSSAIWTIGTPEDTPPILYASLPYEFGFFSNLFDRKRPHQISSRPEEKGTATATLCLLDVGEMRMRHGFKEPSSPPPATASLSFSDRQPIAIPNMSMLSLASNRKKAWFVMISSPDFVKSHLDPYKKDEEDKLVQFSATDDDGGLLVPLFHTGTGENTSHGLNAGIVYPNIGAHVNGTLNWSSSKTVGRDDWESKIVSFHLTINSAAILSGPKPGRSRKHFHM